MKKQGLRQAPWLTGHLPFPSPATRLCSFSENDAYGKRIDYRAAVSGGLQLVPSGAARAVLEGDYAKMMADGMLLEANEPFDTLMQRCATIEALVNDSTA